MSIVPLNIGSVPNDGNGQDLRSGGQVINANFAELDQRTTAAQSAAEGAQAVANAAIPAAQRGQPNGVAGLDGSGKVPASQLPSYVDDVLEFDSFAVLPATGETGKIYITKDTNSQYRWSGTQYILLAASPGSTDAVPEGAANKYWTLARTLGSVLTGLVTTNSAVIAATDTIIVAFGKLQRQISALTDSLANKASKGANSDITSLTGLTTPLSIAQGGNGGSALSKAGTDDANNTTSPGVYSFSAGGLNLPTASAAYYLRVTINNNLVIQEALGMTAALNGKNYTRVFNGSLWSAWVPYAPTSSSAAWGSITGTLSAQTDLQVALDAKLDASSQRIAKAFAAIAGGASPSIRSSVGVTSVTRESAGQYLVTTSQPWSVATVIAALNNSYAYNQTIICQQITDTTFRIVCGANGAAQDFSFLSILIFKA